MQSLKSSANSKIEEIFRYFNIGGEIDSVYGNWAVSADGDVVNYLYAYAIFHIYLYDNDWIERIKSKVWFNAKYIEDLNKSLERAKLVSNNKKYHLQNLVSYDKQEIQI